MKKDGKDVEGGRCMRGIDGRLNFSEKDRGKVWKEHMERIMKYEENDWDQNEKNWWKDHLRELVRKKW